MRSARGLVALVVALVVAALVPPLLWTLQSSGRGVDQFWGMTSHAADLAFPVDRPDRRKRSGGLGRIGTAIAEAPVTETYVISFSQESVERFLARNNHSDLGPVLHVPAVDGYSQRTLDLWGEIALQTPLNATHFDRNNPRQRSKYRSPHAVGCHLSHWNLLRNLAHRPEGLRPDLYLVFEDDSSCVPGMMDRASEVARSLPPDWDLLFLGGKPFTRFHDAVMPPDAAEEEITKQICSGTFGAGDSPLAPDGSRNLSASLPYWRTKYILNTNAIAVNPKRADYVARVLRPKNYVPLDVYLSTRADQGELNMFMTPRKMCIQPRDVGPEAWEESGGVMNASEEWDGYYWFRDNEYHWERMVLEGCVGSY